MAFLPPFSNHANLADGRDSLFVKNGIFQYLYLWGNKMYFSRVNNKTGLRGPSVIQPPLTALLALGSACAVKQTKDFSSMLLGDTRGEVFITARKA
ncbi:hypothetical protein AAU61_18980 [Desulfocarbo indianensis]|nr:hypothetical protein AAU61_18980 [Desulfocarbo indianensis]